ncbi:hypothetical protein AB4144_56235, partial [Rhizobiaceae sp. 2RAB30]
MKTLLTLDSLALGADGLRPELAELLRRQAALECDPQIVVLRRHDASRPAQAGPFPGSPREGRDPVAERTSRRGRSMVELHKVKA